VETDAKRVSTDLEARRIGGLRYFVGGAGKPVVLAHGLGGWAGNWRGIVPLLTGDRRVIVLDLPGHGGSEPLRGARNLDPFADVLLELLDAEDALPAAWVGHSLGALVGVHAAVRRPDAVTGLVLAAAPGITSSTRTAEAWLTALGVLRPGRIAGRYSERFSSSRRLRTLAFGGWGAADPAALAPELAQGFLDGPPQNRDTLTPGRALVASDPRERLDRVACPCLCLWGTNDAWVPLADGMEYARRLRAPLRTIADCGHLLIGERPEAVGAAVRDFLQSLD
jgi:pimeloyl-ACP methyl ester carboxylesterase